MLTMKSHFPSPASSALFQNMLAESPSDCWWFGSNIKALSLTKSVTVEALLALHMNRHPSDNELLVKFPEEDLEKPLPLFTEIMVTMPRMVSVLAGTNDKIVTAHRRASDAAMRNLEVSAATPVWESGFPFIEITSNVVAAAYDCSFRYLGVEILQSRYLLFNLTFHENEQAWSFPDTVEMEDALPFANCCYLSDLATDLKHLGHKLTEQKLHEFETSEWSIIKHLN
ncbi:MAG: relaxase domain-containing protein [Luteolibacter sp.]